LRLVVHATIIFICIEISAFETKKQYFLDLM